MAPALILETSFLIALTRERDRRTEAGPAQTFLERNQHSGLFTTATVVGELAAGYSVGQRVRWEALLAPLQVLPLTLEVCWEYGKADRYLRANGLQIGANDLWIAATALANSMPVVTGNERHFRRVPGLEVISLLG